MQKCMQCDVTGNWPIHSTDATGNRSRRVSAAGVLAKSSEGRVLHQDRGNGRINHDETMERGAYT